MNTKNTVLKRLISLFLTFALVFTMSSNGVFEDLTANATTTSVTSRVKYSSGLEQSFTYNGYVYTVKYENIVTGNLPYITVSYDDTTNNKIELTLYKGTATPTTSVSMLLCPASDAHYDCVEKGLYLYFTDLPTKVGEKLVAYCSSTRGDYCSNMDKPVATFTCAKPYSVEFSWSDDYSSATALVKVSSTDSGTSMDATVVTSGNYKYAYITFNGEQYKSGYHRYTSTGTYISDICVSVASDRSTAKEQLLSNGYTDLGVDLNGSGGKKEVRIGYKTTDNPSEAIYTLYLSDSSKETITPVASGITYTRVTSYGSSESGNLNEGTSGTDLWLYVAKVSEVNSAEGLDKYYNCLTSLSYYSGTDSDGDKPDGYTRLSRKTAKKYYPNLNDGVSGSYVYLYYKRESHTHDNTRYVSNGDGTHKVYCQNCDYLYSSSTSCSFSWTETKAATCKETGLKYGVCTDCGSGCVKSETIAIDSNAHTYGEWVTTKSATCTTSGTQTATCSSCGATKTQTIAAKGHTAETVSGKSATCTETGLTDGEKCSVCGAVITAQETIPATGHTLTHHDAVSATCTETGTVEYWSCSVCGKNFSDSKGTTEITDLTVDATGHTYKVISTSSQGHKLKCANCGSTTGLEEHVYTSTNLCDVCGYEKKIISVNISWDSMSFTYTDGKWNSDSLEYDEGKWSETKNSVTVENTGSTEVKVNLSYTPEDDYLYINGGFDYTEIGNNLLDDGYFILRSSNTGGSSVTTELTLTGKPKKEFTNATIGTVTITLVS